MNKQNLLKALRTNKKIYAWVSYTKDDGTYIQVVKSDFVKKIKFYNADQVFDATEDENGIWIN